MLQHLRAHGLPAACHSCSYTLDSDLIQPPLEKPSPVPAAASRLWHCDARLHTHAHAPVMVRHGAVTDAAGSRAACRPGALEAGPNDYGAIPRCVEGYGGRNWRCLLGNPLNRAGAEMLADPPTSPSYPIAGPWPALSSNPSAPFLCCMSRWDALGGNCWWGETQQSPGRNGTEGKEVSPHSWT